MRFPLSSFVFCCGFGCVLFCKPLVDHVVLDVLIASHVVPPTNLVSSTLPAFSTFCVAMELTSWANLIFGMSTIVTASGLSASSCAELGWFPEAPNYGTSLVCGASKRGGSPVGSCSGPLTWDQANSFCTEAGARVCTLAELQADEAKGTGCLLNKKRVWSDDPCEEGQWSEFGSTRGGSEPLCSDNNTLLGARCCADAAISVLPCAELEFEEDSTYGSSMVCGASKKGGTFGSCSGTLTWDEANSFCADTGARLCSLAELQADETRGTGCLLNKKHVWSNDACFDQESGALVGHWTEFGSTKGGSAPLCSQSSSLLSARCCGDVFNPTAPAPQPTGAEAAPRPTPEPTLLPTPTPQPTPEPTPQPVPQPTPGPTTILPVLRLTRAPTLQPSPEPTPEPTLQPTPQPTPGPSPQPTPQPTPEPTPEQTTQPTSKPTPEPTQQPTPEPTPEPTLNPVLGPTFNPTAQPSAAPQAPTPSSGLLPTGLFRETSVLSPDVEGSPLQDMPECDMVGSPRRQCILTFGPVAYTGSRTSFNTRGYQKSGGFLTGPIIRVQAGETFEVTLNNALAPDDNTPAGTDINVPHHPNSTNLHTHGLHISGLGDGDNVFLAVGPRETKTYTYALPPNHMPGTFFYHPHLHGSVSIQFGGGASGMIIVEDGPSSLPSEVLSMEECALVLSHIEPVKMQALQNQFNRDLWQVSGPTTAMLLTNGQSSPSKTLLSGTWYRFRIVFTSDVSIATLSLEGAAAGCEMQLLAKDGIYLSEVPRPIPLAYLAPGGRADIAMRCSGTGRVDLNAEIAPAGTPRSVTYVALQLTIEASAAPTASDITPFKPRRPCYLVDTSTVAPPTSLSLTLGTGVVNTNLNGVFYESPDTSLNPTNPFTAGETGEITFEQGTFVHVFHMHVNPFQLHQLSPVIDSTYFQRGDWHDTFNAFVAQVPPVPQKTVVRFWVDRYTGNVVVHCHMSTHEDEGMMNTYLISGTEGATADQKAKQVDPLCY